MLKIDEEVREGWRWREGSYRGQASQCTACAPPFVALQSGEWCVVCGVRSVECGVWCAVCGVQCGGVRRR